MFLAPQRPYSALGPDWITITGPMRFSLAVAWEKVNLGDRAATSLDHGFRETRNRAPRGLRPPRRRPLLLGLDALPARRLRDDAERRVGRVAALVDVDADAALAAEAARVVVRGPGGAGIVIKRAADGVRVVGVRAAAVLEDLAVRRRVAGREAGAAG